MKRKLLIIPGGGDPASPLYKKGFDLVKEEALKRGFESVEILKFPGHLSYSDEELFLNQEIASKILIDYLKILEKKGLHYTIFGRSYGCGVILRALSNLNLYKLESIKLWGPVPILGLYQVILGLPENILIAKEKGCNLNIESFNSCIPFEIQLFKYNNTIPLKIGIGSLDKYSKPSFYNFLEEYIPIKENVSYTILEGLEHEVLEKNEGYFNFIFN